MLRLVAPLALLLGGCVLPEFEDEGPPDLPLPPSLCRNGELDGRNEECDDGNASNGDGCSSACLKEIPVTVAWRITTLAGEPVPCPLDHEAEVVVDGEAAILVDGKPAVLPCEGGALQLSLVRGNYLASVRIVDRSTRAVWGESEPDSFAVVASQTSVSHRIVSDAGRLAFGWSLRNAADLTIDCAFAGVTSVRTVLSPAAGGAPIELTTECKKYGDISPLILAGTYDVSIQTSLHAPVTIPGAIVQPRAKTGLPPVALRP